MAAGEDQLQALVRDNPPADLRYRRKNEALRDNEGISRPWIRVGLLTDHAAIGPEEEFPAMAPGRLIIRVVRVSTDADIVGTDSDPPVTPLGLRG
jgi:hypothetical protein